MPDAVTGRKHYDHVSGVECWDVVEQLSYNLGNAVKYLWRRKDKDSELEDLGKAANYIRRTLEKKGRARIAPVRFYDQYWENVTRWHKAEPPSNIRDAMWILMTVWFSEDQIVDLVTALTLVEEEIRCLTAV